MLRDESIVPYKHGEWPYRRSRMLRYSVAALAVLLAFSVRYVIYGDLQSRLAFTFFVPAAIVAVWYGGLGPGIAATLFGVVLGEYIFIAARGTLLPLGVHESMSLGVFGVTTLVCVMLCENLHRTIRRLEHLLAQTRNPWQLQGEQQALNADSLILSGGYVQRSLAKRYGLTAFAVLTAFALRYWFFGAPVPRKTNNARQTQSARRTRLGRNVWPGYAAHNRRSVSGNRHSAPAVRPATATDYASARAGVQDAVWCDAGFRTASHKPMSSRRTRPGSSTRAHRAVTTYRGRR